VTPTKRATATTLTTPALAATITLAVFNVLPCGTNVRLSSQMKKKKSAATTTTTTATTTTFEGIQIYFCSRFFGTKINIPTTSPRCVKSDTAVVGLNLTLYY
jgi:hypothetical protein